MEISSLPHITEIVAAREERGDAHFAFLRAVVEEVLTEASFGGELSVLREVVVQLVRFHVRCSTFKVSQIKSNVEVVMLTRMT